MPRRRRWTEVERRTVAARQNWRCALCRRMVSAHFEVDHIVCLASGGGDTMDNLQCLCADCHRCGGVHARPLYVCVAHTW